MALYRCYHLAATSCLSGAAQERVLWQNDTGKLESFAGAEWGRESAASQVQMPEGKREMSSAFRDRHLLAHLDMRNQYFSCILLIYFQRQSTGHM